jgi:hypothetical protein
MMKNVFVDTGECNLVVLVINLLFKASKVATLDEVKLDASPKNGIRKNYFEDDTMDHPHK